MPHTKTTIFLAKATLDRFPTKTKRFNRPKIIQINLTTNRIHSHPKSIIIFTKRRISHNFTRQVKLNNGLAFAFNKKVIFAVHAKARVSHAGLYF